MPSPALPAACDRSPIPSDYHPLEIIPFFRRFRAGPLRDVLYTFIWSSLLALAFWGLGMVFAARWLPLAHLLFLAIFANVIGYVIHFLFVVGAASGLETRARAGGNLARAIYYAGVSTLGVLTGAVLVAIALDEGLSGWMRNPRWFGTIAFSSVVISVLLCTIFFWRAEQARAEAQLQVERVRAERIEREAALATLRALQAQIEPHFLFNTLANVASLIDPDPRASKRMLERFIRFLRASLAATRGETTTLRGEAELIGAYLDVLQERMGRRLRHSVEIEAGLEDFAIAPMLVQPVVENAIRHGLEPKVEGGEVRVSARRDGSHVVVEVADTGVGFAPATAGGVGLTNLRDRLRLLYGETGDFEIREHHAGGTVVRLRIPA